MEPNQLNQIKNIVEEFFQKATFTVSVEMVQEAAAITAQVRTDEPQVLIGERGQTLAELQHLLRIIVSKKAPGDFYFNLDINNYKQKKYQYLEELARATVDEVFLSKKEKELIPMPAHERRIIHLYLKDRSDVTTESIGEGLDRRIVIRPKE